MQSWDRKIEKPSRFKVVLDGGAVLDNETGLVWDLAPDSTPRDWQTASNHCHGGVHPAFRVGFRLPKYDEILTLFDTSVSTPPTLTPGHPFQNISTSDFYWTATPYESDSTKVWTVQFIGAVTLSTKSATNLTWCVRGPGSAN